jgi:hypothetical protein
MPLFFINVFNFSNLYYEIILFFIDGIVEVASVNKVGVGLLVDSVVELEDLSAEELLIACNVDDNISFFAVLVNAIQLMNWG